MDWLQTELMTGFQKLICLSFDRQPAVDLIPGTVMAWEEAIMTGRAFDKELDAWRFRKAFVTLAATRRTWPTPADFMEVLPPRETQKCLPTKVEDTEASRRIMKEIAEKLGLR